MMREFDLSPGFGDGERAAAMRAIERLERRVERVEEEATACRYLLSDMGKILKLASSGSDPVEVVKTIRALASRALSQVKTLERKS